MVFVTTGSFIGMEAALGLINEEEG